MSLKKAANKSFEFLDLLCKYKMTMVKNKVKNMKLNYAFVCGKSIKGQKSKFL